MADVADSPASLASALRASLPSSGITLLDVAPPGATRYGTGVEIPLSMPVPSAEVCDALARSIVSRHSRIANIDVQSTLRPADQTTVVTVCYYA